MNLSKSLYTAYCQCPKRLWLKVHLSELEPPVDSMTQARFDEGTEVGKLAQQLFPGTVDATTRNADGSLDIDAMLEKTRQLMADWTPVIAEAAFSHDSCYCAVDLLRREGDGWAIYEVKSSTTKDEDENIIYESEEENDFYEFNHNEPSKWVHYDDGEEDWEADPELQEIVDSFNKEHIMDDWESGYYIVKLTKEKWGHHTYVVELDEPFDIKKLQLVYMQGYFGLHGDEWTSCRNVMYGKQYIEHGDDDDCCDFYGAYLYLYEKKKDKNGEYWNEIKDLESYWEDD